ncbi:MAG: hypothetical protein CMC78_05480 [Flavobacteriaceae bacterium]|nr:hypothetical protein [Flavobacteriaceae bacterium]
MSRIIKKLIFSLTFNSCLFLLLMIGIQNSSKKSKVNFLIDQTVQLPISFIIGSSFISGSIIGNLFNINFAKKFE